MKNLILGCGLILTFCLASFGQAIVVYDPVKKTLKTNVSAAEKALVEKIALPAVRERWKNNESCAESFEIISDATGSFTKKNAKQKAILYEFCQTGNGWSNGGIVLFEAGKIVAHYVFDSGGWEFDLDALPDINRNGFYELAIAGSGGMHQGYIGQGISIVELKSTGVNYWGATQIFFDSCGASKPERPYCEYNYKITATPDAKPAFTRLKMVESKKKWKMVGQARKVSLEKGSTTYEILK